MEQLPTALLQSIIAKVSASDCARAACVARFWNQTVSQDALWEPHCRRDFPTIQKLDPLDRPCSTWKETYQSWKTSRLFQRSKLCWDSIRSWARDNFKEVSNSLAPGATLEELAETEATLKCRFPPAARLLYRLCNGQRIPENVLDDDQVEDHYVGLIGGYNFSHHFVNVHLLSLRQMLNLTSRILPSPCRNRRVIIAASSNLNKFIFLDCEDGNVYVGTRNLLLDGEMMACVPEQDGASDEESQDGMLRWLEHYAHCLQVGMFSVRTEEGSRSISLYPETEPYCNTAVTRGVQVRCSGVFVPELSRVEELEDSYWFSYSVRMCLLNPSSNDSNALTSCQLSERHWVIRANDSVVAQVHGRAVIGLYPLLRIGEEEFVYESCTGLSAKKGSLDGDFTFVPGRISVPTGDPFKAVVAKFPLEVPQYIY
ncbi:F-box protein SKIP16 [Physcomitrium patens]|uniref:ApaG domain-containing protein n=1 Tax=Physcomitrium patens TaxID=3218 RepID=A0A2K1KJP9_PHYPA|nr:F-box protein SKIP16-like [Physcomitrium patens]PNR53983.1 hypothetical protein PHYPA_007659 [Physcomitrium patens]|eukprot:XP_024376803.1 F-box protein SKIP16-like [Physcomitrella patens]